MILQQDIPDDYVIATGHQYSVRQFVESVLLTLDTILSGMAREWMKLV